MVSEKVPGSQARRPQEKTAEESEAGARKPKTRSGRRCRDEPAKGGESGEAGEVARSEMMEGGERTGKKRGKERGDGVVVVIAVIVTWVDDNKWGGVFIDIG